MGLEEEWEKLMELAEKTPKEKVVALARYIYCRLKAYARGIALEGMVIYLVSRALRGSGLEGAVYKEFVVEMLRRGGIKCPAPKPI